MKLLLTILMASLFFSCSKDDLTINEDLKEVGYDLPQGEAGSLDALIYEMYRRYGTYVLYDFSEQDVRDQWTYDWSHWYAPVKVGNEQYVQEMLEFIQKNLLEGYTDDFVRKNLVYRIFLVDSLCKTIDYNEDDLVGIEQREHAWIISNIGPQLDNWNETAWTNLKNELISLFTLSFYNGASIKPTQFMALRFASLIVPTIEADPEGKYGKEQYGFYKVGYVRWRTLAHGRPNSLQPKEDQDFADYITFLTTTPATELEYVLNRFEKMRERAKVFVPYLNNVLELNVVATQNKNCPEDKVSEDFFANL